MAIHIPGTNLNIGKDKSAAKKKALKNAYAQVLRSSGTDQSKVTWPDMQAGPDEWYGTSGSALRKGTSGGMMREAEAQFPASPNYQMKFNQPGFGLPVADRAFSSSGGFINIPDPEDMGGGYMSKPQYLQEIISHEVAHNVDRMNNGPWIAKDFKNRAHSIEKFRPLEKAASRAAMVEPQYDPGTDVRIGGVNEYADRYLPLGPYTPNYYLGLNPQDLARSPKKVDAKALTKALALQRQRFTSTVGKGRPLPGVVPSQASLA